jgi:hypothetical protein
VWAHPDSTLSEALRRHLLATVCTEVPPIARPFTFGCEQSLRGVYE